MAFGSGARQSCHSSSNYDIVARVAGAHMASRLIVKCRRLVAVTFLGSLDELDPMVVFRFDLPGGLASRFGILFPCGVECFWLPLVGGGESISGSFLVFVALRRLKPLGRSCIFVFATVSVGDRSRMIFSCSRIEDGFPPKTSVVLSVQVWQCMTDENCHFNFKLFFFLKLSVKLPVPVRVLLISARFFRDSSPHPDAGMVTEGYFCFH